MSKQLFDGDGSEAEHVGTTSDCSRQERPIPGVWRAMNSNTSVNSTREIRSRRPRIVRGALAGITTAVLAAIFTANPASAVQSGTAIGPDEQQNMGTVMLANGAANPHCSGVALSNDWILTAGHCVVADRVGVNNLQVTMLRGDAAASSSRAQAIYMFAGFSDEVGPDIALVHLAGPLTIHGSTSGFTTKFWGGSMADLATGTRLVSVYGQGWNTYTACGTTSPAGIYTPPIGLNAGTLRSGTSQVSAVGLEPSATPGDVTGQIPQGGTTPKPSTTTWSSTKNGRYFQLKTTSAGQVILPGDSGGPAFIFNPPDKTPYLVGVNDSGDCVAGPPPSTPKATTSWEVGMPAVRDWIHSVLSSSWAPGSTGSNVWVDPGEVNGTNWAVGDVNTSSWAQAARAASAMCFNRGFAAGHYDGHQGQLQGRSGAGIICSGGDTRWLDVSAAQIAGTGWVFNDVNQVNWALASRAAERLCAGIKDGAPYAGGQFNGHQLNGNYGLFCYRGGANWFDATDAEIAATGFGFDTTQPETVPWAQAARAATNFCRAKGFAGGFMNGQHVPNKSGVVCQK
jgi:hypothetical protein